ncbi:DUF4265 domain-containing protein [Tunturibacter empetritectus]|uniref:DUF4265 domain-containing protein n=1 Tax=Tunturiibacter empetritectus TaxID=3069691 RepID=A0A7W8IHL4_9BACT|nr:DUF4265 domain-containing protein [Edaphobacter lichenicola]MBB5317299.1 hypothetical protein [Edaphobacter lichenicola]
MSDPNHVKIGFYLEQDEDGWPPVTLENLWAIDLGEGRYRIDNIPFYVRGVSDGDLIAAKPEEDGRLVFSELVEASPNSTFRLVVFDKEEAPAVRKMFRDLGCPSELVSEGFISLHIPGTVEIKPISTLIEQGEENGQWDFEEGVLRHPNSGFSYLPQ